MFWRERVASGMVTATGYEHQSEAVFAQEIERVENAPQFALNLEANEKADERH